MGCPRVCGPKDWGSQWLGRPPRVGVPKSLWTQGLGFPVVGVPKALWSQGLGFPVVGGLRVGVPEALGPKG